ncbi:MAG: hypothetical protein A2Y42_01130 [Omnitrophica WOR_2 bacterium GWB2_45_9]|nr:MAG: hypothetical protein A2Y42_01130 [Omnitrophica WOR_2 bacterium GWB2_45_9]HBU07933.1 hypothetical protein [Candidatus Omnitrophota bacterium]
MKKTVVYAVILSVASIVLGLVAGVAIERGNTIKQLTLGRPELPFEKQREERKARKPQDIFKRVSEELNLNPEQKERVKQILDEARKKISLTGEKSREDLKAIRDESHTKIMEILTPQQQEKFKDIISQAQKNHLNLMKKLQKYGHRPGGPQDTDAPNPPPPPGDIPEDAPGDFPDAP